MKVTLLGTGTFVPNPERHSPGFLIEADGHLTLIDPGPGSLRRLVALGFDYLELDAVGVTHRHPDHTLDLLHLFFATRYARHGRRTRPLRLFGPPGFAPFVTAMTAAWRQWMAADDYDRPVFEMAPGDTLGLAGLTVTARAMKHTEEALGYRFEDEAGATLAYSGDTEFTPEVVELARGVDLLLIECSSADADPIPGHLTPAGVAAIVQAATPKRTVLVHLYPDGHEEDRPDAARKAGAPGEILLGVDGAVFDLDRVEAIPRPPGGGRAE